MSIFKYLNDLQRNPSFKNGVYVPPGALDAWASAVAGIKSNQVCIMAAGDSTTQGKGAANWYTGNWFRRACNGILSKYGAQLAGDFVSTADDNANGIDGGSVQATFSPATGLALWPMIGYSQARSAAINDTLSLAPIQSFIDFDLLVYQSPGWADFTVKVDGVTQTAATAEIMDSTGTKQTVSSPNLTCNSTNSGTDTGNRHRLARYKGWSGAPFSSGTHTILITASTAAVLAVGGAQVYPQGRTASGLVTVRHARFGQTARFLAFGPYASQQPNFLPNHASVLDWAPTPNLFICALGINDSQAQSFGQDSLQQALDDLVRPAARTGASLVFIQMYWNTDAWRRDAAVIKNLADAYGAVFINVVQLFGSNTQALNYTVSAGDNHPMDAGYALIGSTLSQLL